MNTKEATDLLVALGAALGAATPLIAAIAGILHFLESKKDELMPSPVVEIEGANGTHKVDLAAALLYRRICGYLRIRSVTLALALGGSFVLALWSALGKRDLREALVFIPCIVLLYFLVVVPLRSLFFRLMNIRSQIRSLSFEQRHDLLDIFVQKKTLASKHHPRRVIGGLLLESVAASS